MASGPRLAGHLPARRPLFPALAEYQDRLEEAGWVTSSWGAASGRRRRVYALTEAGRAACVVQHSEWRGLVRGMQAILEAGPAV